MAARIQRKRTAGWRMPAGAVYVGRPTIWGNPFTVADAIKEGYARDVDEAPGWCVMAYAAWLEGMKWWPVDVEEADDVLARLPELAGKDLACWCPTGRPCHANVLLLHAEVAGFNAANPIGTPVRYWTGGREGEGRTGVTRTEAQVLSGHTPVVWVTGHGACIALTHVQVIGGVS
jgi:hypothetical protein